MEQRGVSRGITAGPTFRGAVALWAATAVNLGSTLLFHSLIARTNGAGTYAAAASLLWFGALASTLSSGVQYALARISATTNATSGDLFRRGLWVAGPWMAVSVLALVFSPEIASYLHLASAWPVAGAAWLWAVTVLYAIPTGIMVGRRKLGLFALLMLAGAGLRFVFMVPFGWSSRYGGAAVVSSALTLTTLVALGAWCVASARPGRFDVGSGSYGRGSPGLVAEGVGTGVLATLLWLTWMLPLLFGRHFLRPTAAGSLAVVQFLLTGVLFLCAPVVSAFHPQIVRHRQARHIATGLMVTVGVSVAFVTGSALIGPPVIHALFGREFQVSSALFMVFGSAATLVATATYSLWVTQALQRFVGIATGGIVVTVAAESLLGSLWHGSTLQLGLGLVFALLVGAAVVASTVVRRARRHRTPRPTALVVRLPSPAVAGSMLSRSVVGVMAHNEEPTVGKCLEAVLAQTDGQSGVVRVVVVTGGCTDRTEEVVLECAARDPRVELLSTPERRGKAEAINRFLAATDEPICILMGADTLPAPGAFASLTAPFADPAVGMTGGRILVANAPDGLVDRMAHVVWDLHHRLSLSHPKLGEMVAFRRVFPMIDETSLADEVSIESLISEQGLKLSYVPEAITFSHGAEALGDYLAHRTRIHVGHLAVSRSTGYRPSTLDVGRLFRLVLSEARRTPHRIPAIAAAVGIEAVARGRARLALGAAGHETHGVWEPISSAKHAFTVQVTPAVGGGAIGGGGSTTWLRTPEVEPQIVPGRRR